MNLFWQGNKKLLRFQVTRSNCGLVILISISILTLGVIPIGKSVVKISQEQVDMSMSESRLWKVYRWSVDPYLRRKAAFLLVAKSEKSFLRKKRLLSSQGWGSEPLAAVAVKLQAQTAMSLGEDLRAISLWKELLRRFPDTASSADAYYILGRKNKSLRKLLLEKHPAHPAALASALEMQGNSRNAYLGALHLAQWGARWHGAKNVIFRACLSGRNILSNDEIRILASALAELGLGSSAIDCLKDVKLTPKTKVVVGQALLKGNKYEKQLGLELLRNLILENPNLSESSLALRSLASAAQVDRSLIESLPDSFAKDSSILAVEKIRLSLDSEPLKVLKRWQKKDVAWELQWELTRDALLNRRWNKALVFLKAIPIENLPQPIAVRNEFWRAFLADKIGSTSEAQNIWREIINTYPPGYYTWRAAIRLEQEDYMNLILDNRGKYIIAHLEEESLEGLESKNKLVNELWKLGLVNESWETWRSLYLNQNIDEMQPMDLVVDGRLRIAVGDEWNGLGNLFLASVRSVKEDDISEKILHRSQYPVRFLDEILFVSRKTNLRPELILAIVKQESRFSSTVVSSMGAIGLMQLMPLTAQEVFATNLDSESLFMPKINLLLGASYLKNLIERWDFNPLLAIASYNAGPSKVSEWFSSEIFSDPELWIERIPYPETRIYTKKVLGSIWSYMNLEN